MSEIRNEQQLKTMVVDLSDNPNKYRELQVMGAILIDSFGRHQVVVDETIYNDYMDLTKFREG